MCAHYCWAGNSNLFHPQSDFRGCSRTCPFFYFFLNEKKKTAETPDHTCPVSRFGHTDVKAGLPCNDRLAMLLHSQCLEWVGFEWTVRVSQSETWGVQHSNVTKRIIFRMEGQREAMKSHDVDINMVPTDSEIPRWNYDGADLGGFRQFRCGYSRCWYYRQGCCQNIDVNRAHCYNLKVGMQIDSDVMIRWWWWCHSVILSVSSHSAYFPPFKVNSSAVEPNARV